MNKLNSRTFLTGIIGFLAIVVVWMVINMVRNDILATRDLEEVPEVSLAEVTIRGNSMEPTLYDGDVLMADVSPEAIASLEKGDIILLHNPEDANPDDYLVKRVVALAGDEVEIKYGQLYINMVYVDYGSRYPEDFGPYTVKDKAVFIIGDNAAISLDSRAFREPSLPLDQVVGKLIIEE